MIRRGSVVLLLATVSVGFWYFRIIAPASKLMFGASDDPYTQIYPMMHRSADWIRGGHLPLWNPYQFSGHPFLAAVLYGVFYPPNLLFLVVPTAWGIEASAVLHLFLAALFTYAYLRELRLGVVPALAGGLTFALSGFFASQALWFMPAVGAGTWLPLGLLAIERVLGRRSLRWAAVLAICVAMPVLAGWLQTWLYVMYALGGYLMARTVASLLNTETRRPTLHAAALAGGAIAIGLAVAAVQLLPSFELQSLGPRQPGGLTIAQSLGLGPMPPERLIRGAIDARPDFPRPNYVGTLWLLLMPVTFFAANRARLAFFWAVAISASLVALTTQTPVFAWYRLLPSSTWFRFPDRILYLYVFSAAVLVAFGFEAIRRVPPRSMRAVAMVAAAAVAGAGWVVLAGPPALSLVYLCGGLALLAGAMLVAQPRLRTTALVALLVLQATDLFVATSSPALHPFHDVAIFDAEAPVLDYVREHQQYARTYIHYGATNLPQIMPKQGTLRGIYSITDYEPLSLRRAGRFYRATEGKQYGPDDPPFVGLINIPPTQLGLRFLDLLGVGFVLVPKQNLPYQQMLRSAGWGSPSVPQPGMMALFTNPSALPRAYVVHETIVASNEDDAFAAISNLANDPRRIVVLEDVDAPGDAGGPATDAFPGATIERYDPTEVVVRIDDPTPGWLVLADTWYPGWTAELDGKPVPIAHANFLFRGVRTTGPGRVVFRYRPRSVRLGATISIVALCIVLGAALRKEPTAS